MPTPISDKDVVASLGQVPKPVRDLIEARNSLEASTPEDKSMEVAKADAMVAVNRAIAVAEAVSSKRPLGPQLSREVDMITPTFAKQGPRLRQMSVEKIKQERDRGAPDSLVAAMADILGFLTERMEKAEAGTFVDPGQVAAYVASRISRFAPKPPEQPAPQPPGPGPEPRPQVPDQPTAAPDSTP